METQRMLVLIYENEIAPDATDAERMAWKAASMVVDGNVVGSPFVNGRDISVFKDARKYVTIVGPLDGPQATQDENEIACIQSSPDGLRERAERAEAEIARLRDLLRRLRTNHPNDAYGCGVHQMADGEDTQRLWAEVDREIEPPNAEPDRR